jgi:MFS family permease
MSAVLAAPAAIERTRSAVGGWLLAVSVYLLAVLHRTSLGVAGLLAQHRFHIDPAQLSVFVFLQLGVYAAMQVPTGVLVDRYGPRRLLLTASLVMGTAQLMFAFVPSYPAALLARGLLGCGDALTFVSVLRFAATRFDPRRYPLLVALTSTVGTAGNVMATLPLALVLRSAGWGFSFGLAGGLSILVAGVVWLFLPAATGTPRRVATSAELRSAVGAVGTRLTAAWALPGTRLGFWVHFACMSATTAFGVLWGSPYLIKAGGLSPARAGAVLMAGVIAAAVASPVFGWLIGRHPAARVPIAIGICAVTMAGWSVVVADGTPRTGFVVALFVVMALGGPASMAAFALARDYNPARILGTASGVVNVGGFLAAVVVSLGVGGILALEGSTSAGTLRWAVVAAVAVQGFGAVRMTVWLLRVRARALELQQRGKSVPVPVVRRRFDLPV